MHFLVMLQVLGLQLYLKTPSQVVFKNHNPTCRKNSVQNALCRRFCGSQDNTWLRFNETVSVVNIESKMMLQMCETSEAAPVSCSK